MIIIVNTNSNFLLLLYVYNGKANLLLALLQLVRLTIGITNKANLLSARNIHDSPDLVLRKRVFPRV